MESRTQGSGPRPRTQKNFEAKAKDRPSRGQGHKRKCSLKQKQKKGLQKLYLGERSSKKFFRRKRSSKIFFQAISTWGNQKRSFADFPQGFWRFPTKFQRFKNSAVLEPIQGNFRGLVLRLRGQGLQNVFSTTSSRPRTSSRHRRSQRGGPGGPGPPPPIKIPPMIKITTT